MSKTVLFDAEGRPWHGRMPPMTHTRLLSGSEMIKYLTVNVGCVAAVLAPWGVSVRLRPMVVTEEALAAAYFFLAEKRPSRIAAQIYADRQWREHLLQDDEITDTRALDLLFRLIADSQRAQDQPIIHRRLAAQELPQSSPLWRALDLWRTTQIPEVLEAFAREHLADRLVWVTGNGPASLTVAEVGKGFPAPITAKLRAAIGRPIVDTMSPAYGHYVREVYSTVASSGRPLLEQVDAWVDLSPTERINRTYRRLILPIPATSGGPSGPGIRLLCLSAETPGAALRAQAA